MEQVGKFTIMYLNLYCYLTGVSISYANIHAQYRDWVTSQSPQSTQEVVRLKDRVFLHSKVAKQEFEKFLKCMYENSFMY